ncbi:glutathione S-transferase [Crepidotus variabilis]|uniref:Glutathione S-transferase n=1 Tax=Crepidotus variabilis TaxID=179855 RepID=A0A9P6JRT0_9AGAR|nr:glutathione S-transferase [Crepidotus variabilis]
METLIARNLKYLEGVIAVTILSPVVDRMGWSFSQPRGAVGGPLGDDGRLRDLYLKDNPHYDGMFTLPVLWDEKTNVIVNNDAPDIVRMFGVAFNDLIPSKATKNVKSLDFFPGDERTQNRIRRWTDYIDTASMAIYRAGYAQTQLEHDAAVKEVFAVLDKVDTQLRGSPFLLGRSTFSEADLRLYAFLIPFDAVFYALFKCNFKSIRNDYPNIHDFLRNLYWGRPAFRDATHFDHIKEHYYGSHQTLNPTRIAPLGPVHFILPYDSKHSPEKLLSHILL